MLDAKVTPFIKPLLKPLIKALDSKGVTPNQVTLAGFVIGVLALPFIILNWWNMALACIILNRVFDGIDGELARYQQSSSSAGGFLDITRVASSDPAMWRDIFLHNGETTADLIREHRKVLERLEALIREANAEGLQEWFESAKSLRSSLENAKEHQRSKPR